MSKIMTPSKKAESKEPSKSEEGQIPEHLLCKLCADTYKEPRILPCLHSFCYQCLQKEMEKVGSQDKMNKAGQSERKSGKQIKCPACNKKFTVTSLNDLPQHLYLGFEVEVAGLVQYIKSADRAICDGCSGEPDTNPVVGFCCECHEFLCKTCLDYHKRNRKLQKHKISLIDEVASIEENLKHMICEYTCTEQGHEKQALDFYCRTCNKPICNYCAVSEHKKHLYCDLSTAADEQRAEMTTLQQSVSNILRKLENATNSTDKMKQQVEASRKGAASLIKGAFEELHHALQEREKILLTQVEKIALSKSTALQLQIDGFKSLHSDIVRGNDMITRVLQTNSAQQVVALRKVLHTSMTEMIKDLALLPNQHSSIIVHFYEELVSEELSDFGSVDDCDLSKSTWMWSSPSTPILTPHINVKYQLKVETKNALGKKLYSGGLPLVVEFTTIAQNQNINALIEDTKDGSYIISFTPAYAGEYKMHITVQGHYIKNSPFDIKFVKRNYLTATTLKPRPAAAGCNQKSTWQCVAVHSDGSIVAGTYNDSYSHIHIHSQQDNKCMRSLGAGNSSNNGSFYNPRGFMIKDDVLYVADAFNNRVQRFKASGSYDFQNVLGAGHVSQPYSLCVDTDGKIFIADYGNSRIQVFGSNSNLLHTIPGNGSGNQNFVNPTGVALDHAGNIHIAAQGTGSIKVFSPQGTYIRMYGDGLPLNKPTAIAIDSCGYSLVCESGTNQLRIFNPEGVLVNSLTGLNNPTSVAVDQNGNVYVANFGTNQILQC